MRRAGEPVPTSTEGPAQATRWLTHCMAYSLLLLLLDLMPAAGHLEVEMADGTQTVFLHENVTIPCRIPGSPHLDPKIMGVVWFQKNESSESVVFEFYGDRLAASRPGANVSLGSLERGDASLHLPGVQLGDAGEYRCKVVVTPKKAEGKMRLEVAARPVGGLFLQEGEARSNESKHVVCRLDGFYSESINVTWEKQAPKDHRWQAITEGFVTGPPVQNADGTFNVTSLLDLKTDLGEAGTTFQCVVWHSSRNSSLTFNMTLMEGESSRRQYGWIIVSVSSCFCVFVMIAALFFWRKITRRRSSPRLTEEGWTPGVSLDLVPAGQTQSVLHAAPRPVCHTAPQGPPESAGPSTLGPVHVFSFPEESH